MLQAIIMLIMGLLLFPLCILFIYKNFISKYKMSRSGLLTLLILALIIISLFCCLIVSVSSLGLQETISYLNSAPNIPQKEIDLLKQSIPYKINEATRYLIVGYSSYVIAFIISKIIQKHMDITTEKNTANRWKLHK